MAVRPAAALRLHQKDLAEGRRIAEKVVDTFHTCPIPEIARLIRTLRR
ncbi:hypothetical protein [Tessaracoccus palaemonis]|uniref:Uncharacterized protein n=1 Tax=Tessaracoccus palaemonis TaxID=2829499 RepID=A0ABX8SK91_9ACTN|nr:hypothetical protein [Tessaracoccus palaemonis]QXT63743.1 hypothetical protein KDB89_04505 [Tessaracoccus palaemonis]